MENYNLCESEYRFASIVWEHEPLGSGELVKLCNIELGWKKSTTYTVLKKLCDRNILQNVDAIVTSLIPKEQIVKAETENFMERTFGGSLPKFIASFMGDKKISKEEAEEILALITSHQEEE